MVAKIFYIKVRIFLLTLLRLDKTADIYTTGGGGGGAMDLPSRLQHKMKMFVSALPVTAGFKQNIHAIQAVSAE